MPNTKTNRADADKAARAERRAARMDLLEQMRADRGPDQVRQLEAERRKIEQGRAIEAQIKAERAARIRAARAAEAAEVEAKAAPVERVVVPAAAGERACRDCGTAIARRQQLCETCRSIAVKAGQQRKQAARVPVGVFRAGPTVWDWDGVVGVSRCEAPACVSYGTFSLTPLGQSANAHARRAHGFRGVAVRVPEQVAA